MPSMDEYLRVKQAAELLQVAPITVRAWGDRGKIPEYRHPANNYRLYTRSELEDLVRQIDQSILAKAFRGDLVPHDPNDEPASVVLQRIREQR